VKLWLLRPIDTSRAWVPWHDKSFGFVIRAESEDRARVLADEGGGAENREIEGLRPWLSPEHSTCVELLPEGQEGEVIEDFAPA
jgi:hypothetical protein